jgi:hypothetical protein
MTMEAAIAQPEAADDPGQVRATEPPRGEADRRGASPLAEAPPKVNDGDDERGEQQREREFQPPVELLFRQAGPDVDPIGRHAGEQRHRERERHRHERQHHADGDDRQRPQRHHARPRVAVAEGLARRPERRRRVQAQANTSLSPPPAISR